MKTKTAFNYHSRVISIKREKKSSLTVSIEKRGFAIMLMLLKKEKERERDRGLFVFFLLFNRVFLN